MSVLHEDSAAVEDHESPISAAPVTSPQRELRRLRVKGGNVSSSSLSGGEDSTSPVRSRGGSKNGSANSLNPEESAKVRKEIKKLAKMESEHFNGVSGAASPSISLSEFHSASPPNGTSSSSYPKIDLNYLSPAPSDRESARLRDLVSSGDSNSSYKSIKSPGDIKRVTIGDYQLGETLGRGASGVVYKGLNIHNGEFVAIKQISKKNIPPMEIPAVMKEVEILKKFNHPNIVRVNGCQETPEHLNIIFEYIENGSLTDIMKRFGAFPESLVQLYIYQVLEGLDYLHQQGLMHRDIKASNILITKDGVAKLADFGLVSGDAEKKEVVGSPYWLAPEVIEVSGHVFASDVWSVGITILELLTGTPPYFELNPMSAMFKIVENDSPPIPDEISEDLREFLHGCFDKDPTKRKSASELKKGKWMQGMKKRKSVSIRDLADTLIQHNQTLRMRSIHSFSKDKEEAIDFNELLKEPRYDDLISPWPQHKMEASTSGGNNRNSVNLSSESNGEKPLSRKRFNSLNSKRNSVVTIKKEGYLKANQKHWFVLYENPPILSYYSKKEDVVNNKSPKGQILLLGCELEKTYMIKGEPFAFFIIQPNGFQTLLCGKSNEDVDSWMSAINECQSSILSITSARYQEALKKQQELIKKLQRGLQVAINENEKKLKSPTEGFYREFFFFLALSVKKNEYDGNADIDIKALYEKAQRHNIPFHKWYEWVPEQIRATIDNSSDEDEDVDEHKQAMLREIYCNNNDLCTGCRKTLQSAGNVITKKGRNWHEECFRCSLCKQSFTQFISKKKDNYFYFFETAPKKKFCKSCYCKLQDMMEKKLITPKLKKVLSPSK